MVDGKKDKISVYIVEDYLLLRISCKKTLEQDSFFDVIGDFENAEDCISALETRQSNIVLMDLALPGINGIEATKIITNKYKDVKVIITTSHESRQEAIACLASGASAYVVKTSDYQGLLDVIKMVNLGALWFDPRFGSIAKEAAIKPNTTDFNNLYDNEINSILTEKEYKVLGLLARGESNVEIAKKMMVSANTTKAHVSSIFEKLAVKDRVQAAVKAVKAGIV